MPASCSGSPTRRADGRGDGSAPTSRRATGRGPSVAFGEGRRPEAATHVRLASVRRAAGPAARADRGPPARRPHACRSAPSPTPTSTRSRRSTSDRMGNVSAFVAVASQLILIKSRAMLPRRPETDAGRAARGRAGSRGGAAGPAAPVPRPPRRRHAASRRRRIDRVGLFRREPSVAARRGPRGRPPAGRPAARRRARSSRRSTAWP